MRRPAVSRRRQNTFTVENNTDLQSDTSSSRGSHRQKLQRDAHSRQNVLNNGPKPNPARSKRVNASLFLLRDVRLFLESRQQNIKIKIVSVTAFERHPRCATPGTVFGGMIDHLGRLPRPGARGSRLWFCRMSKGLQMWF